MFGRLLKTKTFWGGLVVIIGAAGTALTGETTWAESMAIIVPALMGILVRDGIAKGK